MGEDSLLERVTAAAQGRHLSQNTLTAYRRTWLNGRRGFFPRDLAMEGSLPLMRPKS
jgi:hypothetical protein